MDRGGEFRNRFGHLNGGNTPGGIGIVFQSPSILFRNELHEETVPHLNLTNKKTGV